MVPCNLQWFLAENVDLGGASIYIYIYIYIHIYLFIACTFTSSQVCIWPINVA